MQARLTSYAVAEMMRDKMRDARLSRMEQMLQDYVDQIALSQWLERAMSIHTPRSVPFWKISGIYFTVFGQSRLKGGRHNIASPQVHKDMRDITGQY